MPNGIVPTPVPVNEPIRDYVPGSPERASLKRRLDAVLAEEVEIPVVIGGDVAQAVCPHDHGHVLATYHQAGGDEVAQAVHAAANCETSRFSYDEQGHLATITEAAERTTRMVYDRSGRLERHEIPDGSIRSFSYDAGGRMAATTSFSGQTVTLTYGADGRLARKQLPASWTLRSARAPARCSRASDTRSCPRANVRRSASTMGPSGPINTMP
jgi:YD repeat-containing protein